MSFTHTPINFMIILTFHSINYTFISVPIIRFLELQLEKLIEMFHSKSNFHIGEKEHKSLILVTFSTFSTNKISRAHENNICITTGHLSFKIFILHSINFFHLKCNRRRKIHIIRALFQQILVKHWETFCKLCFNEICPKVHTKPNF